MTAKRVLIANRGEVAVRVARAVRELGWTSIGVHGRDEPSAPHLRHCHEQVELAGHGTAAYLDVELIITTAGAMSVDFVHPGYGFLAESPELSQACERAGMRFVGPGPSVLRTLGDKVVARTLAADLGLPVLPGVAITDAAAVESLLAELGPDASIIVKAIGGGGGRGIRVVGPGGDMAAALERSRSEALAAFGRDECCSGDRP